jgi:hypothetical protein
MRRRRAARSAGTPLDQPSDTYRAEYWNCRPASTDPRDHPDLARATRRRSTTTGAGLAGRSHRCRPVRRRWTGRSASPGDYEFAATADDGVRLYVDGVRVIDKWIDQAPTTYRTTLPLDGGPHKVVMEYYENAGGAVARLGYTRVADPPAETGYQAEYWNTPGATGPPSIPTGPADLEREDETLDFDWGEGSPGPGSPRTGSCRWTKTVTLSAGLYRFSGVRDDGIGPTSTTCRWSTSGLPATRYSIDKVVRVAARAAWSTSRERRRPSRVLLRPDR